MTSSLTNVEARKQRQNHPDHDSTSVKRLFIHDTTLSGQEFHSLEILDSDDEVLFYQTNMTHNSDSQTFVKQPLNDMSVGKQATQQVNEQNLVVTNQMILVRLNSRSRTKNCSYLSKNYCLKVRY